VAQSPVAFWNARTSPTTVVIAPPTAIPEPSRPPTARLAAISSNPGTMTNSGQPNRPNWTPNARSARNRTPRTIRTPPMMSPPRSCRGADRAVSEAAGGGGEPETSFGPGSFDTVS
jgi:hypothetical protein